MLKYEQHTIGAYIWSLKDFGGNSNKPTTLKSLCKRGIRIFFSNLSQAVDQNYQLRLLETIEAMEVMRKNDLRLVGATLEQIRLPHFFLAHRDAQVGDGIYMLENCRLPVVLRSASLSSSDPARGTESEKFRFVGESCESWLHIPWGSSDSFVKERKMIELL